MLCAVLNLPKPTNFLNFHRPKLRLNRARNIPPLTQESKQCLRNLSLYRPPKSRVPIPRSRRAAVLVALFIGRKGDLYVLLSRRSATLRTYAGDTSLPGGKVDPEDTSIEDTARREAFEEIGLPRDRRKVPLLCVLEPFLAGNDLVVTPVVVLILDNTLRPILNHTEVTSLFSHPLPSFLSSSSPFPHEPESLEVPYHSHVDWEAPAPRPGTKWVLRAHRFLTGREAGGIKPVFGLTAAILIRTATVAYARLPEFEVQPPDAPSSEARMAWAVLSRPVMREACREDGVRLDEGLMKRLAGVSEVVEEREGGERGNGRMAKL